LDSRKLPLVSILNGKTGRNRTRLKIKLVAKTKHYKPVFSHLQRFLFPYPRFFFVATSPTLPHVTTPVVMSQCPVNPAPSFFARMINFWLPMFKRAHHDVYFLEVLLAALAATSLV